MIQEFLQSVAALADTLAEENRALAGLDFGRAVMLLETKQRATDAFAAAHHAATPDAMRTRRSLVEPLVRRLRDLADENKRLLERAVTVQGRVIGAIAGAIPKTIGGAPRYGSRGALADVSRMRPIALSARA